jgi:hypothetical protein
VERFAYLNYRILSPAGVFTAELSALFTALRHIAEVIRPPERFLILTDSLSSIKAIGSRRIAHPLVYECKQLCWSMCQNGNEVKWNWSISGHDRLHWKAPSLTDHCLQAISRVWPDRR